MPSVATLAGGGLEPGAFRAAMGNHAASVAVLTVRAAGQVHGVTLSSLVSLSLEPPLVLFALRRDSSMLARLGDAVLGLTVLDAQQGHIAQALSRSGRPPVPDAWLEPCPDAGDAATVEGGAVQLTASLAWRFDAGDHACIVARVRTVRSRNRPPLLHFRHSYAAPCAS